MLALPAGASSHVSKSSGPFEIEFGWGNEPPLSGLDNFVDVGVTDASGAPVSAPAGALSVAVTFGSASTTLPLEPGEEPGTFRAELVPTRPGTYAMRITGRLKGHTVEVSAGCSEKTFECVSPASDAEFPVKDPSRGELAQLLQREQGRADDAADKADTAQTIAIIALALALSLGAALALAMRRRRKS